MAVGVGQSCGQFSNKNRGSYDLTLLQVKGYAWHVFTRGCSGCFSYHEVYVIYVLNKVKNPREGFRSWVREKDFWNNPWSVIITCVPVEHSVLATHSVPEVNIVLAVHASKKSATAMAHSPSCCVSYSPAVW